MPPATPWRRAPFERDRALAVGRALQ